ncbi:MAG: hypothetical protein ACYCSQ_04210 [bacterium]
MDFLMARIKLDCGISEYADNSGKHLSEIFYELDKKQIICKNGDYKIFLKNLKDFKDDFICGQIVIVCGKNKRELINFYFNTGNNFLFVEEKLVFIFGLKTIEAVFSVLINNGIKILKNMEDCVPAASIVYLDKKVKLMKNIEDHSDFIFSSL